MKHDSMTPDVGNRIYWTMVLRSHLHAFAKDSEPTRDLGLTTRRRTRSSVPPTAVVRRVWIVLDAALIVDNLPGRDAPHYMGLVAHVVAAGTILAQAERRSQARTHWEWA
jgi:hypothetical protein